MATGTATSSRSKSKAVTDPFTPHQGEVAPRGDAAEISAKRMIVTPAMAREWLERNPRNRKLDWPRIEGMARDMQDGMFLLNGETVIIASDDQINDGQQRLQACVLAKVPFETFVVVGVTPASQDTVDIGKARTLANQLTIHQTANASVVAAIANQVFRWDHGQRARMNEIKATVPELTALIREHPDIQDVANFAVHARGQFNFAPPSVYGICKVLFDRIDKESSESFLNRVVDGVNIDAGHPAHTLRKTLMTAERLERRLKIEEIFAYFVYAWNAYRGGTTITKLQLPKHGLNGKNFPVPK